MSRKMRSDTGVYVAQQLEGNLSIAQVCCTSEEGGKGNEMFLELEDLRLGTPGE